MLLNDAKRKLYIIEPTETLEQQRFVRQCQLHEGKYPALRLLYAVPNEGQRSIANASRMRAEGLRAGVPDLCLPVARGGYFGWYAELKRLRSGSLSMQQAAMIAALREEGYWANWHRGAEEMWQDIMLYLRCAPTEFAPRCVKENRRSLSTSRSEKSE